LRFHIKLLIILVKIILILLLASSRSNAESLSLDECLNLSQEQNPSLQQARLSLSLNTPAARAAWGQFLPAVSVGYGMTQSATKIRTYLTDDGRVIELPFTFPNGEFIPIQEQKTRNSSYFINAEEILFNGGRNYFNLKNAKLNRELRDKELSVEELNVRSAVTGAFCSAYAAQEGLNLAEEVLAQRQKLLELAQVRLQTGSVTRRDVMQSEVDLGRAKNDSIAAGTHCRRAIEQLNLAIGLPVESAYNLEPLSPLNLPQQSVKQLTSLAQDKNSELAAADLSAQIYGNNVRSAKGDYLPYISASIYHSRSEQSGTKNAFTLDPRNRSTYYRLDFSWSIFDRFTRSLRLQEAKVQQQRALMQRNDLKRTVRQRVSSAWDKMHALDSQLAVAEQNVELARVTLRFEEERYRLGSATTLDIGAAQVSYIQARQDKINLQTEIYIARAELEQAIGMALNDE